MGVLPAGVGCPPRRISSPTLDYELERAGATLRVNVTLNSDARAQYLAFAAAAPWLGNFRDLAASVLRMATLAEGGRITGPDVAREVLRLQRVWGAEQKAVPDTGTPVPAHGAGLAAQVAPDLALDAFDAVQMETCAGHPFGIPEAWRKRGRKLFAVSRDQRASTNDSDRVRKYLAKWGLEYAVVKDLLKR